ncbi:hypothetical protein VB779_01405 [Haloarculaceae archaeon H-GB11]|nr:hypothetical protein [Haloarculaceae archaeon H-GB11]
MADASDERVSKADAESDADVDETTADLRRKVEEKYDFFRDNLHSV